MICHNTISFDSDRLESSKRRNLLSSKLNWPLPLSSDERVKMMNPDEAFARMSQEMFSKLMEKNPDLATELGLHEPYDYLLPEGSADRYAENLQTLQATLQDLKNTLRRGELSHQHEIDWEVIEKAYELWKFAFNEQRIQELNPDAFAELGGLIFIMVTRNYAPLGKRMDAIAARIEKIPKYLKEFRERFENQRPVKLWTEMAIEAAQSIEGLFQLVLHAAKGNVPDRTYERLNKAWENLQPALSKHMEWLRGLLSKTSDSWALGKEKFEKLLQLRDLSMNSDEIYRLGTKYLKELKTERKRLAREIGSDKPEDALKSIEAKAPRTFEDALEFTRRTMKEARDFVREEGIATVYLEDVLLVEETPAYLAATFPFAGMIMPAKFDKPQIGIYIVTRPKDIANLGKQLNFPSIRNVAVHEAFPGHFLQATVSNRGSIVQMLAQGTETVEGWAHYCEQMMAEKGFIKDLETRFIQVNQMIWRAVRIIVDVKLSRGEMNFEEAAKMLMRETRMSRESAEAEVKRYTQTPGYALSYLLGKHLILKLKEEVKQKMGNRFSEKLFHDTITANGYLPISTLRKVFDQKIKELKTQ
jgi:uncharacterized protein (DUF885 family)